MYIRIYTVVTQVSGIAAGTEDEALVSDAREGLADVFYLSSVDGVFVETVGTTMGEDDDDDDGDATPAPVGPTLSPSAPVPQSAVLGDGPLPAGTSAATTTPPTASDEALVGDGGGGVRQRNRRLGTSLGKNTPLETRRNSIPVVSRGDVATAAGRSGDGGVGHQVGFIAAEVVGSGVPASGGGEPLGGRRRYLQSTSASSATSTSGRTLDLSFEVIFSADGGVASFNSSALRAAAAVNNFADMGLYSFADAVGADVRYDIYIQQQQHPVRLECTRNQYSFACIKKYISCRLLYICCM